MFQQLVRLLFRLNVRDTQVGLKVFRREVADQVLPLLMVKRYAFDIELLAVARAFGFTRIAEMPVKLDYRFTGSGVRSRAVLRAVVDTFAVFYRLRILRYYQRRRRFSGAYAFTRPQSTRPRVTVLLPEGVRFRERDFPSVELIAVREGGTVGAYREAALRADGEVIAILEPGVRAAGNWLSATTPFLARSEIGAVVTPKVAPATGSHHARAAAAVVESRVGAGFGYFRHTPGNIRYVRSYPASGIVIRRATLLQLPDDTALVDLVAAVARTGEQVLYTPEAVVVADPAPLFRPHLRFVASRARTRAKGVRRGREAIGLAAAAGVAAVLAVLLLVLFNAGIELAAVVAGAAVLYGIALCVASAAAMFRFQSAVVGALTFAGIVSTHVVYVGAFAHGLVVG
jgi:hypothetical protein